MVCPDSPISLRKPIFGFCIWVFCSFFSSNLIAQSLNDYRSTSSGNWTNVAIWETYNGSTWIAASSYPGQIIGTNDVSIEGGYSVTLSSNIPNSFNSLTVGDGLGSTDTLLISGSSSINTTLLTIANGGYISWTVNVTLALPVGAAFIIDPGGSLDTSGPCSAAKRIQIGANIYSTCNGGAGASYDFTDLNDGGGTIHVDPSSNGPICEGQTLNLFTNPSGTGSSDPTNTFNWSGSGPGGYSYSSTSQAPTILGLSPGTYSYIVTITHQSVYTNTNEVVVIVNPSAAILVQPNNATTLDGTSTSFSVTAMDADTYQWQISVDGGLTFVDLANGGIYSGVDATTLTINPVNLTLNDYQYQIVVSNTIFSCIGVTSAAAVLTVKTIRIITNRGTTYRVYN